MRRGEEGEDKVESRLENHNHEKLGDKSEDGSREVTGGGAGWGWGVHPVHGAQQVWG